MYNRVRVKLMFKRMARLKAGGALGTEDPTGICSPHG